MDTSFVRSNLQFTPTAAKWVIGLSVLGILKSFLIPFFATRVILLYPILRNIPYIYLLLFLLFHFQRSQYASVCFARGLCNFIPMFAWMLLSPLGQVPQMGYVLASSISPILSLVLICYVLGTPRIEWASGQSIESAREPSKSPWRDFFLPPTIAVGLLVVAAILVFLANMQSSARDVQQTIGIVVFVGSAIGIPVFSIAAIIFFLRRQESHAYGSLLTIVLLGISGFFGCVSALSGMSFH